MMVDYCWCQTVGLRKSFTVVHNFKSVDQFWRRVSNYSIEFLILADKYSYEIKSYVPIEMFFALFLQRCFTKVRQTSILLSCRHQFKAIRFPPTGEALRDLSFLKLVLVDASLSLTWVFLQRWGCHPRDTVILSRAPRIQCHQQHSQGLEKQVLSLSIHMLSSEKLLKAVEWRDSALNDLTLSNKLFLG